MAVTVTDLRTVLDQADAVTNFNQGSLNTTDFAESTGSISNAVNIGTDQLFWTGTAINFTTTGNECIYVWSANNATQNSFDAGTSSSHAVWLSDGTNEIIVTMAGNDRITFQHSQTQVLFQCFLIDVDYLSQANTDGRITAITGTFASFDPTAITEVGAYYVTLSKALAGGFNTFIDIIRYGGRDQGIRIAGGGVGTEGKFSEIAVLDRSTANGRAHGIIREYTANTYGVQGSLRFGDTGTASTYFDDSGQTVAWEDRLVADDKYGLFVEGNGTGTNEFKLSNCALSSARPGVLVDASSNNINSLIIDSCSFTSLINTISFPTDTNGTTLVHEVTNCSFASCGEIDPGTVLFTGNSIASNTDGYALLLDSDGSSNWSDISFVRGDGNHAIRITSAGTYDFTNITFSGFGSTGTSTAALYNGSGGSVTINVLGGDSPTYLNGPGSTTTIVTTVPINVSVNDAENNPVQNARVAIYIASNNLEILNEYTDVNGEVSSTYGGTTPVDIYIRIRKNSFGDTRYENFSTNASIGINGFEFSATLAIDKNVDLD